jgi:hypothetical protein
LQVIVGCFAVVYNQPLCFKTSKASICFMFKFGCLVLNKYHQLFFNTPLQNGVASSHGPSLGLVTKVRAYKGAK